MTLEENKKNLASAIGFFDGVHLGHRALLRAVGELAAEYGLIPAAVSFDLHPDLLTGRDGALELITSPEDRLWELRRYGGVEQVRLLHFDTALMNTPWQEFLDRLVGEGEIGALAVGADFTFGRGGAGTAESLARWCRERGVPCRIVEKVTLDGEPVSSSRIRALLRRGRVEEAERLLGHPYGLSGPVVTGRRLGRTLGLPTANLRYEPGVLVPRHGVYAARAFLPDGSSFPAATNVGVRPTVSGSGVSVESHLLGFSGDLYGKRLRLELRRFLRPERRFGSLEELKAQIRRDEAEILRSAEA